jgi:hypothetical protein
MTLSRPLWLLALALVGAAAAWALWRPSRQVVDVGSLALWQEALESLGPSARRRTRRVTASWLLLLAGAAAATFALARPAIDTAQPARHIALEVHPAAELAGDAGARELRAAADAFLRRLSPADRVQLLRPSAAGGATAWLSPAEAAAELARTPSLPVPADQLTLPPADPRAQQVVRLAPAGLNLPGGPHTVTVELPTALPPVTVAEFGAAEFAGGRVQFFVAATNGGPAAWSGTLAIGTLEPNASGPWRTSAVPLTVPPGGRVSIVRDLPPSAAITAAPAGGASPLGGAFLVRRSPVRRRVALTGPDEPLLRRYVAADDTLQLVASPPEADLVIANRTTPPPEGPALVIDPPRPPPPWRFAPPLTAVTLTPASAADDPVMKGVALEAIAVRRVQPWTAAADSGASPTMKVLASLPRGAVLLRSDGDAAPRRVYVTFELSGDNTNLAVSPSLVALLAGAVRWLAPGAAAKPLYAFTRPQDCVGAARWQRLAGDGPAPPAAPGPLPWPGIYRDEAGALHAVAADGLRGAQPKLPPAQAVAAIALPQPRTETAAVQLWFHLLAAAMLFWMIGWAMRVK